MSESIPTQPGGFGKLPCLGDFFTRQLPTGFTEPFDQWLQAGLSHAQDTLGDDFEQTYLTFPVWRFVVPLPSGTWFGVLLPSVDRVGRLFPLTLAQGVAVDAMPALSLASVEPWLDELAALGVQALEFEQIEAFDQRLAALPGLAIAPETGEAPVALPIGDPLAQGEWVLAGPLAEAVAGSAQQRWLADLGQRSVWWTEALPGQPGRLALAGMPLAGEWLLTLIGED
jgi:type VI secretion system protein ImpM